MTETKLEMARRHVHEGRARIHAQAHLIERPNEVVTPLGRNFDICWS